MAELFIELSEKQIDCVLSASNYDIAFLDGAIRAGKTHVANLIWLEYIQNGPVGTLLMAGKTIRTLERNVLKADNGIFDLLGEGNYKYNSSTGELVIGKRVIYCVGVNDEKAESKIRGMTLAGAYCDEVSLYPKNFVEQLQGRCSVPGAKMLWTSNPDSPFHYLNTEYINNPAMKGILKHWRFLMTDNPYLVKCNPEYIERAKKSFTGVFYKRNVLGEWAIAEGRVYDAFDSELHVLDQLPHEEDEDFAYDEIYVGVDYGSVHPTTFTMVGIKNEICYVIKEYCQAGQINSVLARDFIDFIDGWNVDGITVDSAAKAFILELNDKGIYTADCIKDVQDGISLVSQLIGEQKLYVASSCTNLISEFYTYSWDEKKSISQGKDVVIKLSDDVLDGLRYCLKTFYDYNTRAYTINNNWF